METLKAYVHLGFGVDVSAHRKRYDAGLSPDATPYGFHHAETMGCSVTYSVDGVESRWSRFVRRSMKRVLGFDLVHAWRNRRKIAEADVVWTMEEVQYLAVCALPLVVPGMHRPRVIAQTVWLFNRWDEFGAIRRWMLARLLRRADVLTVHSQSYLQLIPERVAGLRPELFYFGISLDSFPWTQRGVRERHAPIRVLSLGNDATRDWETMLEACGNDDRFEMKIVCNWLTDEQASSYRNLVCPRDPHMEEFRAMYAWADVVVVPMVPNAYSGITVALEATSMGVPVVCSATGGVPTYFDAGEVLYVAVQDPAAMRDAVLACAADGGGTRVVAAQERFARDGYSTEALAARYVRRSRALVDDAGRAGEIA